MNTKYLNSLLRDVFDISLIVSILFFVYQTDRKMAVIIGGFFTMKLLASFLHHREKMKEDREIMEELEKILDAQEEVEIKHLKITNNQRRNNE